MKHMTDRQIEKTVWIAILVAFIVAVLLGACVAEVPQTPADRLLSMMSATQVEDPPDPLKQGFIVGLPAFNEWPGWGIHVGQYRVGTSGGAIDAGRTEYGLRIIASCPGSWIEAWFISSTNRLERMLPNGSILVPDVDAIVGPVHPDHNGLVWYEWLHPSGGWPHPTESWHQFAFLLEGGEWVVSNAMYIRTP